MSFRYTNHLVATLKHRLYLEAAHRQLVRRTFTGTCNGVEVTCSAYGSVVGLRMVDSAVWEPLYRLDAGDEATAATATATASSAPKKGIDLVKLAASVQAATWQAIQKLRAAKEEAHGRALRRNPQLLAEANMRDWYEHDANTLQPRPQDALKHLQATEWMEAVRFGVPQPARYLASNTSSPQQQQEQQQREVITVLRDEDCDPANIPIGSVHPLFTPGLVQLELDPNIMQQSNSNTNSSRVDTPFVQHEQRKEMCRDEEAFWERVELIRRSQLAAIPQGGVKRGYADMAAVVEDNVAEKVQLRFTR
ncbi:hypothetical protein NESM_000870200 [Novymonas esmeraldas]|uniref:Uncharacterized protein n=1 Tax=Novymonas esmeraldas TaxID=1808958 RepID=A0AAW0EYR9_9TRYP